MTLNLMTLGEIPPLYSPPKPSSRVAEPPLLITNHSIMPGLKPNDKDYCGRGFVAVCPSKSTQGEQCWKYCPQCEAKGFKSITVEEQTERSKEKKKNCVTENSLLNLEKIHNACGNKSPILNVS